VQSVVCSVCEKDAILRFVVCMRGEDGCMPLIGFCNSPLNNKNIDYHFSWFLPVLGFQINHCVYRVIVVLDLCLFNFFMLY
jgi:hypothetical protein